MKTVMFFNNGNTAVFDEHGKPVPELQESWLTFYVQFLRSMEIDPLDCIFELQGSGKARIFETAHGYSWEFLP